MNIDYLRNRESNYIIRKYLSEDCIIISITYYDGGLIRTLVMASSPTVECSVPLYKV